MVVEGLALNKAFTPHPKKVITEIITDERKSSKIERSATEYILLKAWHHHGNHQFISAVNTGIWPTKE